ncbi:uncharacterized protein L3040_006942 [Drepanopeziza brunnea f. sp. 'multigermtubi']|uniref:uncharacterized protein n=1 Tax=Drepanopeziza brunnea f. sp. 'multigermtubi' TaxID=698441 RepID=UPI00239F5964|nr:hypothetical protein L3040_006942 [Drepanopeziza brunnea f. sp. 'multigermtubi']
MDSSDQLPTSPRQWANILHDILAEFGSPAFLGAPRAVTDSEPEPSSEDSDATVVLDPPSDLQSTSSSSDESIDGIVSDDLPAIHLRTEGNLWKLPFDVNVRIIHTSKIPDLQGATTIVDFTRFRLYLTPVSDDTDRGFLENFWISHVGDLAGWITVYLRDPTMGHYPFPSSVVESTLILHNQPSAVRLALTLINEHERRGLFSSYDGRYLLIPNVLKKSGRFQVGFDVGIFARSERLCREDIALTSYAFSGSPEQFTHFITETVPLYRKLCWVEMRGIFVSGAETLSPLSPEFDRLAQAFYAGEEIPDDLSTLPDAPPLGQRNFVTSFGTGGRATVVAAQPMRDATLVFFLEDVMISNYLETMVVSRHPRVPRRSGSPKVSQTTSPAPMFSGSIHRHSTYHEIETNLNDIEQRNKDRQINLSIQERQNTRRDKWFEFYETAAGSQGVIANQVGALVAKVHGPRSDASGPSAKLNLVQSNDGKLLLIEKKVGGSKSKGGGRRRRNKLTPVNNEEQASAGVCNGKSSRGSTIEPGRNLSPNIEECKDKESEEQGAATARKEAANTAKDTASLTPVEAANESIDTSSKKESTKDTKSVEDSTGLDDEIASVTSGETITDAQTHKSSPGTQPDDFNAVLIGGVTQADVENSRAFDKYGPEMLGTSVVKPGPWQTVKSKASQKSEKAKVPPPRSVAVGNSGTSRRTNSNAQFSSRTQQQASVSGISGSNRGSKSTTSYKPSISRAKQVNLHDSREFPAMPAVKDSVKNIAVGLKPVLSLPSNSKAPVASNPAIPVVPKPDTTKVALSSIARPGPRPITPAPSHVQDDSDPDDLYNASPPRRPLAARPQQAESGPSPSATVSQASMKANEKAITHSVSGTGVKVPTKPKVEKDKVEAKKAEVKKAEVKKVEVKKVEAKTVGVNNAIADLKEVNTAGGSSLNILSSNYTADNSGQTASSTASADVKDKSKKTAANSKPDARIAGLTPVNSRVKGNDVAKGKSDAAVARPTAVIELRKSKETAAISPQSQASTSTNDIQVAKSKKSKAKVLSKEPLPHITGASSSAQVNSQKGKGNGLDKNPLPRNYTSSGDDAKTTKKPRGKNGFLRGQPISREKSSGPADTVEQESSRVEAAQGDQLNFAHPNGSTTPVRQKGVPITKKAGTESTNSPIHNHTSIEFPEAALLDAPEEKATGLEWADLTSPTKLRASGRRLSLPPALQHGDERDSLDGSIDLPSIRRTSSFSNLPVPSTSFLQIDEESFTSSNTDGGDERRDSRDATYLESTPGTVFMITPMNRSVRKPLPEYEGEPYINIEGNPVTLFRHDAEMPSQFGPGHQRTISNPGYIYRGTYDYEQSSSGHSCRTITPSYNPGNGMHGHPAPAPAFDGPDPNLGRQSGQQGSSYHSGPMFPLQDAQVTAYQPLTAPSQYPTNAQISDFLSASNPQSALNVDRGASSSAAERAVPASGFDATFQCQFCEQAHSPTIYEPCYLCPLCGMNGISAFGTKYCSRACLLSDAYDHVSCCSNTPALVTYSNPKAIGPLYCWEGFPITSVFQIPESNDKFRQKAFSMFCKFGEAPDILQAHIRKNPAVDWSALLPRYTQMQVGDYHIFKPSTVGQPMTRANVICTMKFSVEDGTKLAVTRALNIMYLDANEAIGIFLYKFLLHFLSDPAEFRKFGATAPQLVVLAEFRSQFLREFGIGNLALWRENGFYDWRQALFEMDQHMVFWEMQSSILNMWNGRVFNQV